MSKTQLDESVKISRFRLSVVDAVCVHRLDRNSGLTEAAAIRERILPFAETPVYIAS